MFCSKCGCEITLEDKFCSKCGEKTAREKTKLMDLSVQKTAKQAVLLYIIILFCYLLFLIAVAFIAYFSGVIDVHHAKAAGQKYGLIINPIVTFLLVFFIAYKKNALKNTKTIAMVILTPILAWLFSPLVGIIPICVMTTFESFKREE